MGDMKPLYVKVSESKAVFGLHPATIYRAVNRGTIRIHKVGSSSLLKVAEVEAFIEGSKEKSGG